MKKLLIITAALIGLTSCKKAVEKAQENIILDVMTDGQWLISRYLEGTTDLTNDFAAYSFQFYRDGRVSGFSGQPEEKGTWVAHIDSRSIETAFPNADITLRKLNGNWKITDSDWDEVKAETTTDNILKTLWLRKK